METIVITRYTKNRKMYNNSTSSYVSLSEIADLVKQDKPLVVVSHPEQKDMTANVFASVVLKKFKNFKKGGLATAVLREIICQDIYILWQNI